MAAAVTAMDRLDVRCTKALQVEDGEQGGGMQRYWIVEFRGARQ